jgi:hypothetical protein
MKAPPRLALAAFLLTVGIVRVGTAQTPVVSVALSVVPAAPGGEVTIPVTLEASEPVVGFSFGVSHDPAALTPLGIETGSAFVATATNFFPNLDPDGGPGVTVGVVIDGDLVPPYLTLPSATAHEVLRIRYRVEPVIPIGVSPIGFTGALGSPPVGMVAVIEIGNDTPIETALTGSPGGVSITETIFRRGDANDDGGVNLLDVITSLEVIFLPTGNTNCMDVVDVNDDGILGVGDALYLLEYLFLGTVGAPPAPFATCGADPTADPFGCTDDRDTCP